MALKFKCKKCGTEIIVKFLKVGEIAECRSCGTKNIVPETAIRTEETPDYLKGGEDLEEKRAEHSEKTPPKEIIPSILGPKDIGDILSDTFKIYFKNFLRIIAIVFIVQLVGNIFTSIILPTPRGLFGTYGRIQFPTPSTALLIIGIVVFILTIFVGYPFVTGALIHAVSKQRLRRPINIKEAYRSSWKRFGSLVGVHFLRLLAIFGIMFVSIIPVALSRGVLVPIMIIGYGFAFYYMIRWLFVLEVVLVEGLGPVPALSRSAVLVKGDWWRILGIMLLLGLIMWAIMLLFGRIPIFGGMLSSILAYPVLVIGEILLYYDLRVRKDGYTPEVLAKEIESDG